METIPFKFEAGSISSSNSPQKALSINEIAAQLANSKALNIAAPPTILIAAPTAANVVNGNNNNNNIEKADSTESISNNPIVAKMTEALSLKQSPTLTKQLAKPSTSSSSGMQVITQYMCRYCGQQFENTEQMQKHIQEHVEGKTPHECSVCGKTYRTPSKLQRHVRVHSGERPYACSVCGRRFTRSDHVKQHMKVHMQPKDANVFTCHRCGEAFESLEEMQTHKLCHDTVLNSLKDGSTAAAPPDGIAKFSLGPQKTEQTSSMNKYDFITVKPQTSYATTTASTAEDTKPTLTSVLKIPAAFYIPANMDNVSALSSKLAVEGMEKLAKETAEAEAQRKYQDEMMQLTNDAMKFQDQLDVQRKTEEERRKIAQAFTIKAGNVIEIKKELGNVENGDAGHDSGLEIVEGQETTHMVNGDGMSMFILPSLLKNGKPAGSKADEDESDMETEDSEQNSSKDSSAINREGDDDRSEGDASEKMDDSGIGEGEGSEGKISPRPEAFSRPCPRSKKPGYMPPVEASTEETRYGSPSLVSTAANEPTLIAPKPMLSILNPRINELIKAKVEQNMSNQNLNSQSQAVHSSVPTFIVTNPSLNSQMNPQLPKLTLIPNFSKLTPPPNPMTSFQTILPAPISSISSSATLAAVAASMSAQMTPKKTEGLPKLIKCEHCCIYFEDNAMSMLHNTLHSADTADPFTCRKCYKKLGNRLEFMAHLIWHLEPNMDLC
ncbi:ZF69B-like protein [Mya arenaria]|uniref:ZF69B-like protein n=1 Tax=Mya arenaria TaxID=6604 RepID=A0ABY7F2B7_MYAAR|nr:ZF69B-like protein [Mya arenaria]